MPFITTYKPKYKHKTIKTLLLFIVTCLLNINLYAQCYSNFSSNAYKTFQQAEELYKNEKPGAFALYKKAFETDTMLVDALFKMAVIEYNNSITAQYDITKVTYTSYYQNKAEKYFLQLINICPQTNNYLTYLYLGELYFNKKSYNKAHNYLTNFVLHNTNNNATTAKAKKYIELCNNINTWYSTTNNYNIINLSSLNTNGNETKPCISHNGHTLIYRKQIDIQSREHAYNITDDNFIKAIATGIDTLNNILFKPIGQLPVYLDDGYFIDAITHDILYKKIYATICKTQRLDNKNITLCNICSANINQWPYLYYEPLDSLINCPNSSQTAPSISGNSKLMFFASNKPGGMGGFDIYLSTRDSLGNWTTAVNAGPKINGPNDEINPFIHYDNKTLYFASNSHFGIGGYDLFMSKLNDTTWSDPQNLGSPFNTEFDDKFITIDANGNYAYLGSKKYSKHGGSDIILIQLPQNLKPESWVTIGGQVFYDNIDANSLKIELFDLKGNNTKIITLEPDENRFNLILQNNQKPYLLKVNCKNCLFTNKYIDLVDNNQPAFVNIVLQNIKPGASFFIDGIFFPSGSALLDKKSEPMLNSFADFLMLYPKVNVNINICANNKLQNNISLYQKRAIAIFNYLRYNGIMPQRVTYQTNYSDNNIHVNNTVEYTITVTITGI